MTNIAGLILAGGLARRMGGGDKGLLRLGGRSILSRVIETIRPQVSVLALNANGDPSRFQDLGLPVLPDVIEGFPGPLAGVLTGLEWARTCLPDADFLLTVPCDTPFLPADLAVRLSEACSQEKAEMARACSGGQDHPVAGLWPLGLADDLRRALVEEDIRKIERFTQRYRLAKVVFAADAVDPFFNVNTPEDVTLAEKALTAARP
jgi:molybdopterin-guanine dinucleotide biosynthesis protein A